METPTQTPKTAEDVVKIHEAILSDLLNELPYEAKLIAMAVLSKHQEQVFLAASKANTELNDPVYALMDAWMKIALDADRKEEERDTAERNIIRTIFKRHGFTVKEGQTDLKEYVYTAARDLIDRVHANLRRIGAIAYFLTSRLSNKEQEQYEAMEDRSKWTYGDWARHLGATEDDQHRVVFGSWYALGKMFELRDKEITRQAVLLAKKEQKV